MHTICHFEIPTTDLTKSETFFGKVFGWKCERDSESYVVIHCDDGSTGGIYKVGEIKPSQVMIYIEVDDIDKTLNDVVKNGGSEIEPKRSIGEYGFVGAFADPCGGRVELWSKN